MNYSLYLTAGVVVIAAAISWRFSSGSWFPRRKRTFSNIVEAAAEGSAKDVQDMILANKEILVDAVRDPQANTALSLAAMRGDVAMVRALLAEKAFTNAQNVFKFTPLHMAAYYSESLPTVMLLLDAKANIEAPDQNGWTALHIAASKGNKELVSLLLSRGAQVNATTTANQTPILMAACNGHTQVVQELIKAKADTKIRVKSSHESALIYAVQNGHFDIARALLEYDKELVSTATVSGSTPLHVSVQVNNKEMAELLLTHGADVNSRKGDGDTPLHVACLLNRLEFIPFLVERGANIVAKNNYGATVLHSACSRKRIQVVEALIAAKADVTLKDNDGLCPLHTLCSSFVSVEGVEPGNVENVIECKIADLLLSAGVSVNIPDRVGGTPLHHVVCKKEHLGLLKWLLLHGADTTVEDKTGWTALHLLVQMYPNPAMREALEGHMCKVCPEFLAAMDLKKPRGEREYVDPAAALLTEAERTDVLGGEVTLEAIAKRILSGKSKNIIVMSGAGISTNAGIPDFRSPDKGLYTNKALLSKFNLTSGESIFSIGDFMHDPELFYAVAKELFLPVVKGRYKPTLAHRFLALLYKKGLLLRNYTQNIDMLEHHAGIPEEKLVEAHGSFNHATCMECHAAVSDMDDFWATVETDQIPVCERCRGTKIKPDVVFFGEGLPARFNDLQKEDFAACDMLIVMGTSLTVYPFAGLATKPAATVPRLLINGDLVGPFRGIDHWKLTQQGELEAIKLQPDIPNREVKPYRDVAVVGDIDRSVAKLAALLGWTEELEQH